MAEKNPVNTNEVNVEIHTEPTGISGGRGWKSWLKKYFWEGQTLDYDHNKVVSELSPDASFTERLLVHHRRLLGILIPMTFFITFWLAIVTKHNLWFTFKENYFMSIVMVFGSLIAGMTSEGGGAIAFPVMTLAFNIHPNVARDFSLIVQSCGMTAATFTIFFMRVKIDWTAIINCSIGGVFGVVFGLELIDPYLAPAQKKFIFVSVWFSFGFALFLLNRYHKRRTFLSIPRVNVWKICFLLVTGFFGGNFTAIAASGLDICTFSILTLVFRVTEKTATPTSVVLMGGNTLFAFFWRDVMMHDGIHPDAWNYLVVSAPIVVIGAPLGSIIGTHFHRLVLATFVYIVGTASLIGAFAIISTFDHSSYLYVLGYYCIRIHIVSISNISWTKTSEICRTR
ncbi:unnamed protein product [Owenia fusiformis]|uniref:Membrane transporter protein n=1 Tax=Owenia fusiformis TaxID=6347 RepID=A0A8S4Q754_OWEFU|nr:unnamed protein product [Owenia fusiformis]